MPKLWIVVTSIAVVAFAGAYLCPPYRVASSRNGEHEHADNANNNAVTPARKAVAGKPSGDAPPLVLPAQQIEFLSLVNEMREAFVKQNSLSEKAAIKERYTSLCEKWIENNHHIRHWIGRIDDINEDSISIDVSDKRYSGAQKIEIARIYYDEEDAQGKLKHLAKGDRIIASGPIEEYGNAPGEVVEGSPQTCSYIFNIYPDSTNTTSSQSNNESVVYKYI